MSFNGAAQAPMGYVEFCKRLPAECNGPAGAAQTEVMAQQETRPVLAQYDWSEMLASLGVAAPATEDATLQSAVVTATTSSDPASTAAPAALLPEAPVRKIKLVTSGPSLRAESAALSGAEPPPVMTGALWSLITTINNDVNRAIAQRSDQQVYGREEVWNIPLEFGIKAGDCEDFALEKRHQLAKAGVPASALSIAVVSTPEGGTHAVLLVATDRGEYVLDNLTPWVLPWAKTPYRWRERQVAGSASHWCQTAFKSDPRSACKTDPSGAGVGSRPAA